MSQVEHVFDVLGWGESVEREFKSAEFYENASINNYWRIDLVLPEPVVLDYATVTGLCIWASDTIPLQMEYQCTKCDGDVVRVIQLDTPDAIPPLLLQDLGISVGLK